MPYPDPLLILPPPVGDELKNGPTGARGGWRSGDEQSQFEYHP